MKGDRGCMLVVDDNEVNRDLLARLLQRQGNAAIVAGGGYQVNPLLRATRIGACLAKKRIQDGEPADRQKFAEKQEKSECLLGKEETNG
jgi:CheY-like chemotaxis protein